MHKIRKMNLNATTDQVGSSSNCKRECTISLTEPACLINSWLFNMVGVKRPARETDRPNTKKLKVLNQTTPRPTQSGTKSSRNLTAQSLVSDGTSSKEGSNSELAAEEDDEDFKQINEAGQSNGPSNTGLNGRCPLLHLHNHVC